jgi:hypothetical protein
MSSRLKIILTGIAAFACGGLLVFYFTKVHPPAAGETTASEAAAQPGAAGEPAITLNEETQKRLGLETMNPAASQWQNEIKGYGRVIDPATLAAAATELEAMRGTAEVSGKEYGRLKTLAAQNNVSARSLEAAKAASAHDELAFAAARAKFAVEWGGKLAENALDVLKAITDGKNSLVRIDLPAGEILKPPARAAEISVMNDETNLVAADFFDAGLGLDPQTQMQSFLFMTRSAALMSGAAVSGALQISGEPLAGVTVPAGAVVRHQGKGWVYVQTGDDKFARREIPLDRFKGDGWFVSENLTATDRIVVVGAQTVLSAEMTPSDAPVAKD